MEGVTKEEQNKLYDETVFADTSENCSKTSTKYKERLIEVQKAIKSSFESINYVSESVEYFPP
jgi:hypothetical protein